MTEIKCLSWLLTCTSLICFCNCQDSVVTVIQRLNQFEEELLDNKVGILRVEQKVLNIINVAKTSLRTELTENIRNQVKEAMAEILQGESLQDMVKSQVVSEMRHLKQGYHQTKRQLHHVSRSLKDFQDETTAFHESVMEKAQGWNGENSSDVCVRENHRLEIELQKCDVYAASLKTDIERFTVLNETCQSQISQLKTAQSAEHVNSKSGSPVLTMSMTTLRPEEEKRRILIVPYWSYSQHHFRQLTIHSNSLSEYPYLSLRTVLSVAYIAKTKKLLIGLHDPDKIVSSPLDTSHVTVLKIGVAATGIEVDEDRDIVFISTYRPRYTISRMSTQGKNFIVTIDLSEYESYPRQITLDTRRKRIYWCSNQRMFTVAYDGRGLATLATGRSMSAVTLDQTAGVLYFNNGRKLMKMTVSNNVSTEVTTLRAYPRNIRLYRGIIHFSGYDPPLVGAVNVTYSAVPYNQHYIRMVGVSTLHLCLIP